VGAAVAPLPAVDVLGALRAACDTGTLLLVLPWLCEFVAMTRDDTVGTSHAAPPRSSLCNVHTAHSALHCSK
jgi:hypothetical protein